MIKNKPLSSLTSFGIGGPAKYFIRVTREEEARQALDFARGKCPYFILGGGSNLLFPDEGYPGLVIHNRIDYLKGEEVGSGTYVTKIFKKTGALGFLAGVPATIGGALSMNAGAFGKSVSATLKEVVVLEERPVKIPREEIVFGYRKSSLKGFILRATFTWEKSPLQDRSLQPKERSAGCVFKNPLGASAGYLLDCCGLKGKKVGGAMVSPKHANFIINTGKATAKDVLELMEVMHSCVLEKFHIDLEREIQVVSG